MVLCHHCPYCSLRIQAHQFRKRDALACTGTEPMAANRTFLENIDAVSWRCCIVACHVLDSILLLSMARRGCSLWSVAHYLPFARLGVSVKGTLGGIDGTCAPCPHGLLRSNRLLAVLSEIARSPFRAHCRCVLRCARIGCATFVGCHFSRQSHALGTPTLDGHHLHRGLSLLRSVGIRSDGAISHTAHP